MIAAARLRQIVEPTFAFLDALTFLIFIRFSGDAILTAAAAWLIVCAGATAGRDGLETALAWAWTLVALIAGAGVILGETGGLGANGFLAIHLAELGGLAVWRRHSLAADFAALRTAGASARQFLVTQSRERIPYLGMLLVLAGLTLLAAWAEPVVYDAQAYHLPRIAHWLQDGRIELLAAQDERLNFVTGLPDLVMAWLLTATSDGFRLVNLAQAMGGLMTFGATVGLARQTGLGRGAALRAGALLFGMGNVVVQFTATQTDLFTTGMFAAAFYLWLCALRRGQGSVLGGLGAGLALAAKGTLFYLAPGAALWVGWLAWRHPLPWRLWRRTLLAAMAGVIFFAGPGFLRNWRAYGSVLGPKPWVEKLHHAAVSPTEFAQKMHWNLQAALAQDLEPNSQPHLLRGAAFAAATALTSQLPGRDQFSLDGSNRRDTLQRTVLDRREPDADATSFGAVVTVLFLMGSLIALSRWRHPDGRLVLVWSGGTIVFFVFFEAMQQWHPFAFRYFVLVAPWIALVAAWGIEQLTGRLRFAVWAAALAAAADVGWTVTTHTHQAGWRAVVQPERSHGYFAAQGWRDWSQRLGPADAPLALALPQERPLAGFYRQHPGRPVHFKSEPAFAPATAEDFVRDEPGWTIVPAMRFVGHEGQVLASVWLDHGDEASPFSVAAYRRLRAGEQAAPVAYRHRHTRGVEDIRDELLVKTWTAAAVQFAVSNPAGQPRHYRMITPLTVCEGTLAAGASAVISTALPDGSVSAVNFIFARNPVSDLPRDDPEVELIH